MSFDRLAPGSLVFVTGATGFIGSATTDLLLSRGFKVRAATRDVSRAQAFKEYMDKRHGAGKLELVEVKDFTAEGAYDAPMQGVSGVIHLATDASFSPDYNAVVVGVEKATRSILAAAAKVPTIKSFVLTSSRVAAFMQQKNIDVNADKDTWADFFVPQAKTIDPKDPNAPVVMYAASKVAGERAAWDFVAMEKPSFAFNAVLPDYVLGPVFNPAPATYSTHGFLNDLFKGKKDNMAIVFMDPASRAVDVRDVAAVHVAALLSSTTDGERLWAAPHKYTVDKILGIWRKAFPEREFLPDYKYEGQPDINVDDKESDKLVRALMGRGWISLEDGVIANVQELL